MVSAGCICDRCSRTFFVKPEFWRRREFLCPLCNPLAAEVERNAYRWQQQASKVAA